MAKLQAIQVDENTVIYVEATEDIETSGIVLNEPEEVKRSGVKGAFPKPATQIAQSFQAIESTIRVYTTYTLNAFREMSVAEVKKVNLEFGVNISGVGGIPYIKITVECEFPELQLPSDNS
jgi:Trypsin-co-occurring domain 1